MDNKKLVFIMMVAAGVLDAAEGAGSPFRKPLTIEVNSPQSRRAIASLARQLMNEVTQQEENHLPIVERAEPVINPLDIHSILRSSSGQLAFSQNSLLGSTGNDLNFESRMPEFTLVTQVYHDAQHAAYPFAGYLPVDRRNPVIQDIAQINNPVSPPYYGASHRLSDDSIFYLSAPQTSAMSPFLSTSDLPVDRRNPVVQDIAQINNPVSTPYYGASHRLSDDSIFYLPTSQTSTMSPLLSQTAVYAALSPRVEEVESVHSVGSSQENFQLSDDADDATVSDVAIAQDLSVFVEPSIPLKMRVKGKRIKKSHTFSEPKRSEYKTEEAYNKIFNFWYKSRNKNIEYVHKSRAKRKKMIQKLIDCGMIKVAKDARKLSMDQLITSVKGL